MSEPTLDPLGRYTRRRLPEHIPSGDVLYRHAGYVYWIHFGEMRKAVSYNADGAPQWRVVGMLDELVALRYPEEGQPDDAREGDR